MDLLLLDTETSGVDSAKDHLVEVATAIYSVEHASIVKVRSWLVKAETNEAQDVNGIPVTLLREHPQACDPALTDSWVMSWAKECDAIAAHQASFDRQWFGDPIQRHPWVCTLEDVSWPKHLSSRSLTAIALAHGVGVVSAHRALTDVMTMALLLQRVAEMGVDVEAMIERGMRPKAKFIVKDRAFSEERNELAKKAGFTFDRTSKTWGRFMPPYDTADLPFAVEQASRLYTASEIPGADEAEQMELTG